MEKVHTLIAGGADVFELDSIGSPLHWAAGRGHLDVVEALLAAGADPNQVSHSPDLLTPLHMAAGAGRAEVIELLITNGAEVDASQGSSGTPLYHAAMADRLAAAEVLIDAGADVNDASESRAQVPLHAAVQSEGTQVMELLIANGAEIDPVSLPGFTPLRFAIYLTQKPAIPVLLEAGADPTLRDDEGRNAYDTGKSTDDMRQYLENLGITE